MCSHQMHWDTTLEKVEKKSIPNFCGVYPADSISQGNGCFILNTDVEGLPGTHWVWVFRSGRKNYFFDSYGRHPSFYHQQLWRQFSQYNCNDKRLQGQTSTVCGDWCLLFLKHVSKDRPLSSFSENLVAIFAEMIAP